jgi:hypothetical protein
LTNRECSPGTLDEQPHNLEEAKEKAKKKKVQKEERERKKKERDDAIVALAKKYDQSVAGIKLRLFQLKDDPVNTLDTSLENEQRIKDLKRDLRIVESLYKDLLMKVDYLAEEDPNATQLTVEDFSKELNCSMDEAAEVLVRPSSLKFWTGPESSGVVDIQTNTQLVKQPELEEG